MDCRRVVITGMGAITPIGNDVDTFWNGLKEGKNGIEKITRFDASDLKVKLAAEVKGFDPKSYMDFKEAKRMARFSQYAIAASDEAMKQSGIDMSKEDPYRVGVIVGSGIGDLESTTREALHVYEGKKVAPLYIPMTIANMASANISIRYGMKGKSLAVVTACATGSHSIGEAFKTIKYNDQDIMVAGGAEETTCPLSIQGFTSLTALTTNSDPDTASRPFDRRRDGFVLGEGAGIIIMEELGHALRRGAKILGEIVGYGSTNDAYHITSPSEDGSGAGMAMRIAMNEARIREDEVDYINAHGTSTHHNDLFETRAIKYAFGNKAYGISINSTKSMIGHTLGAAGGIEAIATLKAIEDSYVHVTRGLEETEEEMDLDYQMENGRIRDIRYAMSNSLGFGGHNATLLFKKYEE